MTSRSLTCCIVLGMSAIALVVAGCQPGSDAPSGPSRSQSSAAAPRLTATPSTTPPTTVEYVVEVARIGDVVRIQSTLVTKDGVAYLCDWVMESDPMQPGDPKIAVAGIPLEDFDLDERRGVLSGEVDIVIRMTSSSTADFVRAAG